MKNTILIKQKHTTERDVVIELPYYSISEWYAYKVISEEKAIQVFIGFRDNGASISFGLYVTSALQIGEVQCTEAEFMERYNSAKIILDKQLT